MHAPHAVAHAHELANQHALPDEGVLQVQLVNPTHERQVSLACWPGRVVHRASADRQLLGLSAHRQFVVPVDQHHALSNPALRIRKKGPHIPSIASSKKSFSMRRRRATLAVFVSLNMKHSFCPAAPILHFKPKFPLILPVRFVKALLSRSIDRWP